MQKIPLLLIFGGGASPAAKNQLSPDFRPHFEIHPGNCSDLILKDNSGKI